MEWIITDDNHESPSGEEPNSDGNLVGSGTLKKGPWTPAEDAILAEYVRKHGDGNWNAVQKFSGLSRCGKSCRLRWANHLRPDLKKGAFTPEEERTIIKLHAKLGNKWARMAAKLPGRTDNEIKNFWNTRIKRLQRDGLQIYPDDVLCLQKSSETQQSQHSGTYSIERPRSHDFMKAGNFEIPVFEMEPNFGSELYSHQSKLLGIPPSNMLQQGFLPSRGISYPSSIIHPRKRLRESDISHGLNDTATSCFSSQRNSNFPGKHHQPYELPPYHSIGKPSLSFLPDSHVLINGNPSTSDPNFGPQKLELPSFQNSAYDFSSWDDPPPLLPGLQCTDTLVKPPQAEPNQVQYTPDTDGLLESLVWPKKRVKTYEYETVPKEKITSDLDDPLLDLSNPEWHLFTAPLPPMEPSAASIFSDFFPNDVMLGPQAKTCDADPQQHPIDPTSPDLNHITDYSNQLDLWRPDDTWWDANLLGPDKYNLALQEVVPGFKDDTNYLHQHPLPGQF